MPSIWKILYDRARQVQNGRVLTPFMDAGGVAAAILTKAGNIYVGVCIDTCSSLGMCAERNAMANMITNGENHIDIGIGPALAEQRPIPAPQIVGREPPPRVLEAVNGIAPRAALDIPQQRRGLLDGEQSPEALVHSIGSLLPEHSERSGGLAGGADDRLATRHRPAAYGARTRHDERTHIGDYITEDRHLLK